MNDRSAQRVNRVTQEFPPGTLGTDDDEKVSASEQLLIMKKELDLLQIELAAPKVPWYKQIPILVSIGALLLSLMTTFYSERRSNQQQLHDARVELRQLIVQIDEVSREITDIEDQYRNNPTALSLARSLAFTRKIILVNQAAEVADEIDEDVSPAEYYAIGSALASLGTTDPRVFKYYNRGLAKGTDPNSKIALYRSLALSYFAAGDATAARKSYESALAATLAIPSTKKVNDARTHMTWATSEVYARHCGFARKHFNASQALLADITREGGVVLSDYKNQLDTLRKLLQQRC